MDGLTDEERILAWKAGWNPSFDGIAIVNEDFTFRAVNQQFCELLGVTHAQLIGQRFQDITPPELRKLDEANATLLKQGVMDFYVMQKAYDFGGGHTRNVVLLVTRVPKTADGAFQFFLSRIMLDAEKPSTPEMVNQQPITLPTSRPESAQSPFLDFISKYYKLLITLGIAGGAAIVTIIKAMKGIQ